ncbi:MAG: hypothetical protein JW797_06590 [Bradymonadales bacterium]|nr:hypothetical protein [Bradymonadales bacterium]
MNRRRTIRLGGLILVFGLSGLACDKGGGDAPSGIRPEHQAAIDRIAPYEEAVSGLLERAAAILAGTGPVAWEQLGPGRVLDEEQRTALYGALASDPRVFQVGITLRRGEYNFHFLHLNPINTRSSSGWYGQFSHPFAGAEAAVLLATTTNIDSGERLETTSVEITRELEGGASVELDLRLRNE